MQTNYELGKQKVQQKRMWSKKSDKKESVIGVEEEKIERGDFYVQRDPWMQPAQADSPNSFRKKCDAKEMRERQMCMCVGGEKVMIRRRRQ